MGERPGIVIEGLSFEWDPENGVILIIGQPVVCTWIETTMAGQGSGKALGRARGVGRTPVG
jgi:hypothetical protein